MTLRNKQRSTDDIINDLSFEPGQLVQNMFTFNGVTAWRIGMIVAVDPDNSEVLVVWGAPEGGKELELTWRWNVKKVDEK